MPQDFVERLLDFLRLRLHPSVPEQGSVGASGDLAPLAPGPCPSSAAAVPSCVVSSWRLPLPWRASASSHSQLEAKEGLALLNGTQQMSAIGALLVLDAERLDSRRQRHHGRQHEALLGTDVAFAADYHAARPHPGQVRVAWSCATCCEARSSSKPTTVTPIASRVGLSVRCVPQVHSATLDSLRHARTVLEIKINSATDDPLVFPAGSDADPGALATEKTTAS